MKTVPRFDPVFSLCAHPRATRNPGPPVSHVEHGGGIVYPLGAWVSIHSPVLSPHVLGFSSLEGSKTQVVGSFIPAEVATTYVTKPSGPRCPLCPHRRSVVSAPLAAGRCLRPLSPFPLAIRSPLPRPSTAWPASPKDSDSSDPNVTSTCGTTHGKGDGEEGGVRLPHGIG